MRILVLVHEFPPIGGGGGRVAQDLCQGMVRRGHEITVITAHMPGLPRQEILQGVRLIRLSSLRRQAYRASLAAMGAYIFAGTWNGVRLSRQWKPDLVHVHFAVPAGVAAWALGRLEHLPYVLTAHLGDVPGGVPEKTGNWFRWVYPFTPPIWKSAAQVVAVSEHTRQLALRHYPIPIQVIPNGVDLAGLDPGTIHVGEPPQIVFVGRFVPQKNPLRVVESLAGLQDLPWKCVMVGDGPLRLEVELAIEKYKLGSRFTLTGWIAPEQVIEWYRQSDLLFMPSLSEGFPVAGVQALAMGLAIVASRVGGFADIVTPDENGCLLDPDQQDGYSQALRSLLCDPNRLQRFREASRAHAGNFNLSAILDSYEQVYRAVALTSS
jgi:L-malate glycosyltransferase